MRNGSRVELEVGPFRINERNSFARNKTILTPNRGAIPATTAIAGKLPERAPGCNATGYNCRPGYIGAGLIARRSGRLSLDIAVTSESKLYAQLRVAVRSDDGTENNQLLRRLSTISTNIINAKITLPACLLRFHS